MIPDRETDAKSRMTGCRQRMGFLVPKTMDKKGMIAVADQGIASATNFFTTVIIGRFCTQAELGLYTLGFSIVLFVLTIQASIITTPYLVYCAKTKDRAHAQYRGSTLIHVAILSIITMFFLAVGSVSFSFGSDLRQRLGAVFSSLVMVILFINARDYVRQICFAALKVKKAFIVDLAVAVLQIGGLALLVYYDSLSARSAFVVTGISCGIIVTGWLAYNKRSFPIKSENLFEHLKLNWAFGKWILAGGSTYVVFTRIYPWIITDFHGASATGAFSACMSLVFLFNPLLMGIGNYIGPKAVHAFASSGYLRLKSVVYSQAVFIMIAMSVFCAIMMFFGDSIVTLAYGSEYQGQGKVIGILALAVTASAFAIPFRGGLLAFERPEILFSSNLVALVITFVFGIWLVKEYSIVGAALSLLLSNIAASAVRCIPFIWMIHRQSLQASNHY